MNVRAAFPELDEGEYGELIEPLGRLDDEIRRLLVTADAAPVSNESAERYPFQRYVRTEAASRLASYPLGRLGPTFASPTVLEALLVDRLEARFSRLLLRPLVSAVNAVRSAGQLDGATPEDRYREFVARCCRQGLARSTVLKFPLLGPALDRATHHDAHALVELCERLDADRVAIERELGVDRGARVVGCEDSGDTHHRGRAVAVLSFDDGSRLVYKPRTVSCERAFEGFVADLDAAVGVELRAAHTLDRGDYGFVEFVEQGPPLDVVRFFEQTGHLAALLYLLNARDMHFENILTTPDGPVAIDLETILHPARVHRGPIPEVPMGAHRLVEESVSSIGILPLVLGSSEDPGVVDLGFLGDHAAGRSPVRSLVFDRPFTDEVTLHFDHPEVAARTGVTTGLSEVEVRTLGETMAAAFEHVIEAARSRPAWWADQLDRHGRGLTIRYIHNPTMAYEQIRRLASSARALANADLATAVLKRTALLSGDSDHRLPESEIRQLAGGDVPYFGVDSDGTAICDPSGSETGAHLAASPLALARDKFRRLTDETVARESAAIRLAFVARFPENRLGERTRTARAGRRDRRDRPASATGLREVAATIAEELCRTIVPDRFDHLPWTWIGPLVSPNPDHPWTRGALGYDLYTGRIGPALALVAAGAALGERRFVDTAARVFDPAAEIMLGSTYERRSLTHAGFGAFSGLGGLTFALHCAGDIADRPEWSAAGDAVAHIALAQATEALEGAEPSTTPNRRPARNLDVIGGAAGLVLAVRHGRDPALRLSARQLGHRLAEVCAGGDAAAADVWSQSGVAHGVSGPLYALSELVIGDPGGAAAEVGVALDVLWRRLEDFHRPASGRWASTTGADASFTTGWCHGAGGITLAIDAYERVTGNPDAARRRETARDALLADGFGRNLTWCHGDLGNHDTVGAVFGDDDPALADTERTILFPDNLLARLADRDSRYSYAHALMVGSAGVLLHVLARSSAITVSPTRLDWACGEQS